MLEDARWQREDGHKRLCWARYGEGVVGYVGGVFDYLEWGVCVLPLHTAYLHGREISQKINKCGTRHTYTHPWSRTPHSTILADRRSPAFRT